MIGKDATERGNFNEQLQADRGEREVIDSEWKWSRMELLDMG